MAKKIVLIEDDSGIVEVTKIILEEAGYEVIALDDINHIKQFILKELPDLIIIDIWIFDQNGADLVKQFKQNPKIKDIPIIMVSAKQDVEKIAQDCGSDDFLAKPFEIDDLLAKINSLT